MTITTAVVAWTDVCALESIIRGRGVCALVGEYQVAIFRMDNDDLYAVSNFDPFSQAYVMSRGIVGCKAGVAKVAAPIFKQNFNLATGECLDDPSCNLMTFAVRAVDGRIEVGST